MKYTVEIEGRLVEVEVEGGTVTVDGQAVLARLTGRPGDASRVLVRENLSQPFQAAVGEGRGCWSLTADGLRITASVMDFRARTLRQVGGSSSARKGGGTLKAPMPGMVVRVLVQEGGQVVAGQGLVVVEAMKMENELKAAAPATVRKVHVTPGSRVEKGAVLVELD